MAQMRFDAGQQGAGVQASGQWPRRWVAAGLVALGLQAQAQEGDAIHWRAALSTQRDSNLLRLPADANLLALTGRSQADDTLTTASVGLEVDKDYGLQSLSLGLTAVSQRFQRFDQFDTTVLNHRLAWKWSITPHATGWLISRRTRSLNPFADLSTYGERNERTVAAESVQAELGVQGPWTLRMAAFRDEITNAQPVADQADFRASGARAGVRRTLGSGSHATLEMASTRGRYLNPSREVTPWDDRFEERALLASLHGVLSGKTRVDAQYAYARREHPNAAERDGQGGSGLVQVMWTPTARLALQATWARERAFVRWRDAAVAVTDRWSLAPTWQLSAHTQLKAHAQRSRRQFRGGSAMASAAPALVRSDLDEGHGVALIWQPHRSVQVEISAHQVQRHSSFPGLDHRASVAAVSLNVSR